MPRGCDPRRERTAALPEVGAKVTLGRPELVWPHLVSRSPSRSHHRWSSSALARLIPAPPEPTPFPLRALFRNAFLAQLTGAFGFGTLDVAGMHLTVNVSPALSRRHFGRVKMGRRIRATTIDRARVWPVIMSPREFWLALVIFVLLAVSVGVLGLASQVP